MWVQVTRSLSAFPLVIGISLAIVFSDPTGALALLLGKSFALSGDKIKAKAAYQDFLTLWKDADSDIPILREAKAEYAKLQ
jgi:eukaryotic-like serine/threonine-protein kinase